MSARKTYRKARQERSAKLSEQRRIGVHEAAPKVFGPARDPRPAEVLLAAAAGVDAETLASLLKAQQRREEEEDELYESAKASSPTPDPYASLKGGR